MKVIYLDSLDKSIRGCILNGVKNSPTFRVLYAHKCILVSFFCHREGVVSVYRIYWKMGFEWTRKDGSIIWNMWNPLAGSRNLWEAIISRWTSGHQNWSLTNMHIIRTSPWPMYSKIRCRTCRINTFSTALSAELSPRNNLPSHTTKCFAEPLQYFLVFDASL